VHIVAKLSQPECDVAHNFFGTTKIRPEELDG
jgi:hypothetical protein